MKAKTIFLILALPVLFAACEKEDGDEDDLSSDKIPERQLSASYNPVILPTDFSNSTHLTNPYFPATPGKTYIYEGQTSDGLERVEEKRLRTTKTILGITCVEVNVREFLDGQITEETWDWYAQANDGTVWYFGEAVDNYDDQGNIENHNGSWEAGVDGALPGIIMPAEPRVGLKYREEFYPDHAEDEAQVTGTGLTVVLPLNTYTNCIKTRNFTRLEPGQNENKYYAPGVGMVKEENNKEHTEIRLVAIQ